MTRTIRNCKFVIVVRALCSLISTSFGGVWERRFYSFAGSRIELVAERV